MRSTRRNAFRACEEIILIVVRLPEPAFFKEALSASFCYDMAMSTTIKTGPVHRLPADLKKALAAKPKAQAAWHDITPLARNEWICWVITVKKQETRDNHVKRTVAELAEGKRRPCCWPGCPHRNPKAARFIKP